MTGRAAPRRMVITPEQFKEGWVEFVRDGIPNITRHEYAHPVKQSDGNYEVDGPKARPHA